MVRMIILLSNEVIGCSVSVDILRATLPLDIAYSTSALMAVCNDRRSRASFGPNKDLRDFFFSLLRGHHHDDHSKRVGTLGGAHVNSECAIIASNRSTINIPVGAVDPSFITDDA